MLKTVNGDNHLFYLIAAAFVYFSVTLFTQYMVSDTADLDQAEQLLLAQYYQLGYSEQPPLYTWLVKFIFTLTGPSLAALVALKVVLLSSFVGCLLSIGQRLAFNHQQLWVVIFSVMFIPQVIWESQRDLTHTVLVTTLAAATLLQVIRIKQQPQPVNYALLGFVVGLGLISKYNFTLYLAALILATLSVSEYRRIWFKPWLLLSIGVTVVIVLPHFLWAIQHTDVALGSVHKLARTEISFLQSLFKALLAAVAYLSPLWLFALIILGKSKAESSATDPSDKRFLWYLLLCILAVVLLFAVSVGAQKIKDRWYQPLLFFVPLLVAMFAGQRVKRVKIYGGIAVFFAVLVGASLSLRTVFMDEFNHFSRPNMPYVTAFKAISKQVAEPDIILAEGKLLAGNVRTVFTHIPVDSPHYVLKKSNASGTGLLLCEKQNCEQNNFKQWLSDQYGIDLSQLSFKAEKHSFYYSRIREKTIYWATVKITEDTLYSDR